MLFSDITLSTFPSDFFKLVITKYFHFAQYIQPAPVPSEALHQRLKHILQIRVFVIGSRRVVHDFQLPWGGEK